MEKHSWLEQHYPHFFAIGTNGMCGNCDERMDTTMMECRHGLVARYQGKPKEIHVQAVKKIFMYLKGTIDLILWYPCKNTFSLKAYSDAYRAGCVDDTKSTSG